MPAEGGTAYAEAAERLLQYALKKPLGELEYVSLDVGLLEAPQELWRARQPSVEHIKELKMSLIQNPVAGKMLEPLHGVVESPLAITKVYILFNYHN